ncbi:hypothetical protein M8J75_016128 [Diaphorina citri]|nr:hypothetical protein M8J75_016128 [Diaphorina citri]
MCCALLGQTPTNSLSLRVKEREFHHIQGPETHCHSSMASKSSWSSLKGGGRSKASGSKPTQNQPTNKNQPVKPVQKSNQNKPAPVQKDQNAKKVNPPGRAGEENVPSQAKAGPENARTQVKQGPDTFRSQTKAPDSSRPLAKSGFEFQPQKKSGPPGMESRSQTKPGGLDKMGVQKRSFISEEEIAAILGGIQMDRNNNVRESQESLNTAGAACLVNIAKVYAAQQHAFDKLDGSRLVEDVLLKGKYWRDTLSYAEEHKDSICVYGLKIVFHSPSMTEMSKKRFFACIHLHNALRNFGIRSALAVHIDLSGIQHKKVAEISQRIVQLVGDGYNFFALQFKITQTNDAMRKLFSEPGAYGIYIGFAFMLDYLAYRNKCKKANLPVEYNIKKYVEVLGDDGYVIRGIDRSAGASQFEFEVTQETENLHLEYVEHLFNGVRFT